MPTTKVSPTCTRTLQLIADSVARSKKTIVVTGAGISTNCGIPDFRSADGLYNLVKNKYPNAVVKGRDLFDSVVFTDPTSTALFYTFLATLRNEVLNVKDTTPVHKFIRTLAESGRLLRCYTQNIDGLEEREGLITNLSCGRGKRKRTPVMVEDSRTEKEKGCQVVQLHGELRSLRCTQCQLLTSYTPLTVSTLLEGVAPECPACVSASETRLASGKRATKVGNLRPNIVLYGEEHPEAEIVGKLSEADLRAAPDMMIILGTSLKVHGLKRIVKEFAKAVHAKGGIVVFVNKTPPTESQWGDVIDYYVDMDCDKWVADVKVRRSGIWERQTKLPVSKILKTSNHENSAVKPRKIAQPSTPGGRKVLASSSGNAVANTPTSKLKMLSTPMTPPSTIKQRGGRMRDVMKENIEKEVQRTPSKPAKRRKVTPKTPIKAVPRMETPPTTPRHGNRKTITVEINVSTPAKKKVEILEDKTAEKVIVPTKEKVIAPTAENVIVPTAEKVIVPKAEKAIVPKKTKANAKALKLLETNVSETVPLRRSSRRSLVAT
ncbi:hst3 protein [Geopyxis carbonaria]|nr:hst3 protein [Geopyxis carbonaria]